MKFNINSKRGKSKRGKSKRGNTQTMESEIDNIINNNNIINKSRMGDGGKYEVYTQIAYGFKWWIEKKSKNKFIVYKQARGILESITMASTTITICDTFKTLTEGMSYIDNDMENARLDDINNPDLDIEFDLSEDNKGNE